MMRAMVLFAVMVMGCSDDGVYEPRGPSEPDAGEFACADKDGCQDAGE